MIVIISGLPGSGKSYFAEKLAATLHATYINTDRVRQSMNPLGKYTFEDKMNVYREMAAQTRKWAKEKVSVIVDGTFYRHAMRSIFITIAKDESAELHFIEVVADESLVRKRLEKPRKYSEADFSIYEKVKEEFEEITTPHLKIQSTDENITFMLDKAIRYLQDDRK